MQSANVLCLGVSYRTAPMALRECISTPPRPWSHLLREAMPNHAEWCVLSTCNRFELYIAADDEPFVLKAQLLNVIEHIVESSSVQLHTHLSTHIYEHWGHGAMNHLCKVAAGLDSLVLGESQIQGQIIHAFTSSTADKSIGPVLRTIFLTAIRVGKRARSETSIGANAVSVSSIAINLAESMLGDLRQRSVVVIGMGEMGQLSLKNLRARGVENVCVLNRTHSRAVAAAGTRASWTARPMQQLPQALAEADAVFTATCSPDPLITWESVRAVDGQRSRDLLIFDLAVPRDVAPEVGLLANTRLIDVDHLEVKADAALHLRRSAIPQVEAIIAEELALLALALQELRVRPLVVELRCRAERIRQQEIERSLRHIGELDPHALVHIQRMSKALVNKILHEPTICIKDLAHQEQGEELLPFVRALFNLQQNQLTLREQGATAGKSSQHQEERMSGLR